MKKARSCAAVLAVLFLFSACASPVAILRKPAQPDTDWSVFEQGRTVSMPLSFRSADGSRLTVEMRDVYVGAGVLLAEAAVEALIQGPASGALHGVMPEGTGLLSVELSERVANVDLSLTSSMYPVDILIARAALRNTLSAVDNIDYVNVSVDGREVGYNSYPIGPVGSSVSDLNAFIEQTRRQIESFTSSSLEGEQKSVTLYFPDVTGTYFLAEMQDVIIQDEQDYENAVLDALFRGPLDAESLSSPFEGVELVSCNKIDILATASQAIIVTLSAEPRYPALAYASLVYSLVGFIPNIQYVRIMIGDEPVESIAGIETNGGLLTKESFSELLGGRATIYCPQGAGVAAETALVYYRYVSSPHFLLDEMIDFSVFPAGATSDDINEAYLSGDIAIVNFKQSFADKCAALSQTQEFLMVYSIVNTLTNIRGVKRVQFLIDGKAADTLGRTVRINNPLLPNPGIIVS